MQEKGFLGNLFCPFGNFRNHASNSGFTGLPKTVYEFLWVDNDTIALTGGSGEGDWPGALDTYTCELSDLACRPVSEHGDDAGGVPKLASGRGL